MLGFRAIVVLVEQTSGKAYKRKHRLEEDTVPYRTWLEVMVRPLAPVSVKCKLQVFLPNGGNDPEDTKERYDQAPSFKECHSLT